MEKEPLYVSLPLHAFPPLPQRFHKVLNGKDPLKFSEGGDCSQPFFPAFDLVECLDTHFRIGGAHLQGRCYLLPHGLPMPEAAAGGIIGGYGQQFQIYASLLPPCAMRLRFSFCGLPSFTPLYPGLYLFSVRQMNLRPSCYLLCAL